MNLGTHQSQLNRFNGFDLRKSKTVETVEELCRHSKHRAKATVRMSKISLNQYEVFQLIPTKFSQCHYEPQSLASEV